MPDYQLEECVCVYHRVKLDVALLATGQSTTCFNAFVVVVVVVVIIITVTQLKKKNTPDNL